MDFQVEEPAFSTMRDVPQDDNPVCTHSERCQGCPYPAHGFICWRRDGTCLRTDMAKRNKQEVLK
ncbi:MAG: hypothetical protein LKJ90_04560 [Faecalibacterium sp.]|jgi:hypothetical protein|nr:hypothetical protein [Faecalibacterium sp.]